MSKPVIEVSHLSKSYNIGRRASYGSLREEIMQALASPFRRSRLPDQDRDQDSIWALNDVSFEIMEGEVVGIIGRNGAGKSTLLKILSRITEPTAGRAVMRGRVASLLEVGTGFHPELTGRENIFLNGALLGMTSREIRAKFDEIIAFSEIDKFLDTPVKRYSSGMYLRLAFAVAAHLDPEILIIDEVLAVGDLEFQKKCLNKMGQVATGGRTVLFVSHNMAAVKQLCSRACLLREGRLSIQGHPIDVISQYIQETSGSGSNGHRNYRHIKGDGSVQIYKLSINDNPDVQAVVSIFEEVKLRINYVLNEPVNELEFFVLIYSSDGDVVASLFQRDSGQMTKPSSKDTSITVTFKNFLLPGRYVISAGIFDRTRQFLDWVEHVESFIVEPTDYRLGKVSFLGEWSG